MRNLYFTNISAFIACSCMVSSQDIDLSNKPECKKVIDASLNCIFINPYAVEEMLAKVKKQEFLQELNDLAKEFNEIYNGYLTFLKNYQGNKGELQKRLNNIFQISTTFNILNDLIECKNLEFYEQTSVLKVNLNEEYNKAVTITEGISSDLSKAGLMYSNIFLENNAAFELRLKKEIEYNTLTKGQQEIISKYLPKNHNLNYQIITQNIICGGRHDTIVFE